MQHRAKKSLGQNFLIDPTHQRRIVDAIEPSAQDTVLEIGPGRGALTEHLLGNVGRLVLVELDDALAAHWSERIRGRDDSEVRHQDALTLDLGTLGVPPTQLKVVGNIPYNITSPLIFHLLQQDARASVIVLMVQREVADRILAEPGNKLYGALSVGVRTVAQVERLFQVPRGAFRPVPNVDSTVIRLRPFLPARLTHDEERDVRALTRACFGWRRKQLQRILRDAEGYRLESAEIAVLERSGFQLSDRPETLAPEQFVQLARELRRLGRPLAAAAPAEDTWE